MTATAERAQLGPEPFWRYLSTPELNFSTLKHVRAPGSPAHARVYAQHPREQTRSQLRGQALHCAVLEPDLFDSRFAAPPVSDDPEQNTKDGRLKKVGAVNKAKWAEWEAEHAGAEFLEPSEMLACTELRKAAAEHPLLREILGHPQCKREYSVRWTDAETGAACKGRLDIVTPWRGETWVFDIKSTEGDGYTNAHPSTFSRAIANNFYHGQAAWYLDGLAAAYPSEHPRRFGWIAVEAERPWAIKLYTPVDTPDGGLLAQGRAEMRALLNTWVECERTGVWPAYGLDMDWIDVPRYAQAGR